MKPNKVSWIIISNIGIIIVIFILFVIFNRDSQQKLTNQNMNDIVNINQSTANISSAYFEAQKSRLLDICRYAQSQKMSRKELLEYIMQSAGDESVSFQLVDSSANGYVAVKSDQEFVPVSYTPSDYTKLRKILADADLSQTNQAAFAPEFTDNYTGIKSFAIYCYIPVLFRRWFHCS